MEELSISNENNNIRSVICNAQGRKTGIFVTIVGGGNSRLDLDGGYTGKRYSLYVSLSGKKF